jgi:hypothetical protein
LQDAQLQLIPVVADTLLIDRQKGVPLCAAGSSDDGFRFLTVHSTALA